LTCLRAQLASMIIKIAMMSLIHSKVESFMRKTYTP
jgi:hypothetical protein